MRPFDWSRPQRQPVEGLLVMFVQTLWQVLKVFIPVLLIAVFRNFSNEVQAEKSGPFSRLEYYFIAISAFAFIRSFFLFVFFHFFIEEGRLIVKKGWLKKETQIIPLEKIQTVGIEQGPLHQVLGIVQLSVDTAGSQKTELKIEALRKPMAEALQAQLLQRTEKPEASAGHVHTPEAAPLLQLGDRDLVKLALSANHLEAFFALLFFFFGLYNDLSNVAGDLLDELAGALPGASFYPLLFLSLAVLLMTILFSAGRVFFRFYGFAVLPAGKGLHIKSGITHVKERLLPFAKLQYVSWQASWMRKLIGYWILEYHTAGDEQEKGKNAGDIKIPLTRVQLLPQLLEGYHAQPDIKGATAVHMHPSFIYRKFLLAGLLPATVLLIALRLLQGHWQFWLVAWPLLVGIFSWLGQRKFRLWAFDDVVFIRRGYLGEAYTLFAWNKLQLVLLRQSWFQKNYGLADLVLHTASGEIRISHIRLAAAAALMNYALYKTETAKRNAVANEAAIQPGSINNDK